MERVRRMSGAFALNAFSVRFGPYFFAFMVFLAELPVGEVLVEVAQADFFIGRGEK